MSPFQLTAQSNMSLEQGSMVAKALIFEVKVNKFGINGSNILFNSEGRASIMRQLAKIWLACRKQKRVFSKRFGCWDKINALVADFHDDTSTRLPPPIPLQFPHIEPCCLRSFCALINLWFDRGENKSKGCGNEADIQMVYADRRAVVATP